jgi:polar amino acid transport system substrate-binding protein
MRQGQPELKAKVNAAIKTLIKDGKLTEYALKTFPFPIHNEAWGEL